MTKNLNTELYKCIKSINIEHLVEDDIKELLNILKYTNNPLIWNHIALLLSDLKYDKAVPFLIKKIMSKEAYSDNGTLVYALENLDCRKYFIFIIKIICEMEYEARLGAYEIVQEVSKEINLTTKKRALKILEEKRKMLVSSKKVDKGENSTLHFVEKTMELLVY